LKTAVNRYGLSEEPDFMLLEEIAKAIFDYMNRPNFKIGYPVYCEEAFHWDITGIAGRLSSVNNQTKHTNKDRIDFCKEILELLEKADLDDYIRCMTR
jgi:hypothetical protein